jgi:hypothetical protein
MTLSPAELDQVEALIGAGKTPAPAPTTPPIAHPTSYASLIAARRRRLASRGA